MSTKLTAAAGLVVEGVDQPVARVEAIEYTTLLSTVNAVIDDNLFQAVADAGERPQLALRLASYLDQKSTLSRDLQEGDSFSVLVEKRYRDGEYKGYGRILAAHFTNKGKTLKPICSARAAEVPVIITARAKMFANRFCRLAGFYAGNFAVYKKPAAPHLGIYKAP